VETGIAAAPVADREIDLLAGEIGEPVRGHHAHVEARLRGAKRGEPRDEPLRRKGVDRAHGEHMGIVLRHQAARGLRQFVQDARERRGIALAGLCEHHAPARQAAEEGEAKPGFQRLHVLGDGARA
jgi:hypothetical protein